MAAYEIIDELEKYSVVDVDEKGEIDVYEKYLFWNVIRRRELEIILNNILYWGPKLILDYGCGAGWLPAFLHSKGFNVVGVDISVNLVNNAKRYVQERSLLFVMQKSCHLKTLLLIA